MLFVLGVGIGFLLQQRGELFLLTRVHRRDSQNAEHLALGGRVPAVKPRLRGRKRRPETAAGNAQLLWEGLPRRSAAIFRRGMAIYRRRAAAVAGI